MKCFLWFYLLLQASSLLTAEISIRCVPTFENASIYIEGVAQDSIDLRVEYKQVSEQQWTKGHQLVQSSNDRVPRTSILGILPDTRYEIRCLNQAGQEIAVADFKTWADDVPILKTIQLNDLDRVDGAYVLTESGSAEGWIRYVAEAGSVIDGANTSNQALRIASASYMILDNVTLKGGVRHGIVVEDSQHIRIRNCDISGFGRVGKQDLEKDGKYYTVDGKAINYDAGVYIAGSSQVVVEHCFIHDPRNHANSWFYSHPAGPNGIFIRAKGQVVLRYNDFIGSQNHRWNDVIEGYGNGKEDGGFMQDADIYGNYLAFCNDDGIELDGGQCNVRFYGNKIEGALCGISTAPNLRGPSFVYRNLVVNLGDERGSYGSAVKNGGGATHSKGITYFYHNTFFTNGNGIASVGFGKGEDRAMFLGFSRNNLLCVSGAGIRNEPASPRSDFDYDYFSTPKQKAGSFSSSLPIESHALYGPADFMNSEAGDFRLQDTSLAQSGAVLINGFTQLPHFGANPEVSDNLMMPMRPIKVSLDKQQFRFQTAADMPQMPAQELLVRNNTASVLTFHIDQNSAFDWFVVHPQSGSIEVNGTCSLTIHMTEAVKQQRGILPGAFLITFASGVRLPVMVYNENVATEFSQVFYAKDMLGAEHFKQVADAEVQHGTCLDFVKGTHVSSEAQNLANEIELEIEVPASCDYQLYFHVKCPEPLANHNSVIFRVNDGEKIISHLSGSREWTWSRSRTACSLKQGLNRLRISPREQLFFDAIAITTRRFIPGEVIE